MATFATGAEKPLDRHTAHSKSAIATLRQSIEQLVAGAVR